MKFTVETVLDRPIETVWRAYTNLDNLRLWMPTLTTFERISGDAGQPGAVSRLVFVEGGRSIVMEETILTRRDPHEFSARFDTGHGENLVTSRFEPQAGAQTLWTLDAEFISRGVMRFLMFLLKGMIRKRLRDDCNRFKEKLESGALAT